MCCPSHLETMGECFTIADSNLDVVAFITFEITQPCKGASLRVIYLAKRVCCQLVGEDVPQVPLDPLQFMPAPLSMSNAKYHLWRANIPYISISWITWCITSLARLASCSLSFRRYIFFPLYYPSFFLFFSYFYT